MSTSGFARFLGQLAIALLLASMPVRANDTRGALIRISAMSEVAVRLDELPMTLRDEAAKRVLTNNVDFWVRRSHKQIAHTRYVLTYRRHFYPGEGKRQLMLPPESGWRVDFLGQKPVRQLRDGHDFVVRPFRFEAMLLSDTESPAQADAVLATVGGIVTEDFALPLDPVWLFQRTGYACMDESENPPRSIFEENAEANFDHYCEGRTGNDWCHVTEVPEKSCIEALNEQTGTVELNLKFERIPWDGGLAERVRVTSANRPETAELAVNVPALRNNWVVYRYFEPDDCALMEQCVGAPGWRRLLLFDAEVVNRGGEPIHLGDPASLNLRDHNIYEYSACHRHHHFRYYGDFSVSSAQQRNGHKQAFCLLDTDRRYNDESTSLVSPYDSCRHQGMSPGWGDSYDAGLDCQWIDITELGPRKVAWDASLEFVFNPNNMLCEGEPVKDAAGNWQFEETSLRSESGEVVSRIRCDFNTDHGADNRGSTTVSVTPGSFVNEPCQGNEPSPTRDCGFEPAPQLLSCTPGQPVVLTCSNGSDPTLVRVCDHSEALAAGIACSFRQSLASSLVTEQRTELRTTCPSGRGVGEPGGTLAVFASALFGDAKSTQLRCTTKTEP